MFGSTAVGWHRQNKTVPLCARPTRSSLSASSFDTKFKPDVDTLNAKQRCQVPAKSSGFRLGSTNDCLLCSIASQL